jgi:hypothetical protein
MFKLMFLIADTKKSLSNKLRPHALEVYEVIYITYHRIE